MNPRRITILALIGATAVFAVAAFVARSPASRHPAQASPFVAEELGGEVRLDRICVEAAALDYPPLSGIRSLFLSIAEQVPLAVISVPARESRPAEKCLVTSALLPQHAERLAELRDALLELSDTLLFSYDVGPTSHHELSAKWRPLESREFKIDALSQATGVNLDALRRELDELAARGLVEPRRAFRPKYDFLYPTLGQYTLQIAFSMLTQPENRARVSSRTFLGNFSRLPGTNPWDPPFTQFVAHPYKDSISYQLARSKGADASTSALVALLGVVLWEWGFEGWYQNVDRVDVTVGLAGGIALGEASYRLISRMCRDGRLSKAEQAIGVILNPHRLLNPKSCR